MTIVYQILFVLAIIFFVICVFKIGYYTRRTREINIRKRVCDDIKKQIPNCSEEWLNGAIYVISRLNDMDDN